MKLIDAFATVTRYGRRLNHEIESFDTDKGESGMGSWKDYLHNNSTSLQSLQDFLEDVDDPRAKLIRQTLANPTDKRYLPHDSSVEYKKNSVHVFDDSTGHTHHYQFIHRSNDPFVMHVAYFPFMGVKYGFFGDLPLDKVQELVNNFETHEGRSRAQSFLDKILPNK